MNEAMKKIRDELADKWWNDFDSSLDGMSIHATGIYKAGFDAAMERARILEEALNALIIDAIPCTESENPKQFFITAWSFDKTKSALAKFRGEK